MEIVSLHHGPTVGLFSALLFNWKSCCAKKASCMEMRAVMNGWTQEGMNGVQEAVDSGWRKQHLAFGACCSVPCGDKSLSEWKRLQQLNLHFNNHWMSEVLCLELNQWVEASVNEYFYRVFFKSWLYNLKIGLTSFYINIKIQKGLTQWILFCTTVKVKIYSKNT